MRARSCGGINNVHIKLRHSNLYLIISGDSVNDWKSIQLDFHEILNLNILQLSFSFLSFLRTEHLAFGCAGQVGHGHCSAQLHEMGGKGYYGRIGCNR